MLSYLAPHPHPVLLQMLLQPRATALKYNFSTGTVLGWPLGVPFLQSPGNFSYCHMDRSKDSQTSVGAG